MPEQSSADTSFQIYRIYTKDISFEAPNTPLIFQQPWKPAPEVELHTVFNTLETDLHEVVLQVTVTTMLEGTTAFLCQVQQAGLFCTPGITGEELASCLCVDCPTILFPYARECVSSLVARCSFPALDLGPVNFERLFLDHLQREASAVHNGQEPSQEC